MHYSFYFTIGNLRILVRQYSNPNITYMLSD